jgi:hypothetical protein
LISVSLVLLFNIFLLLLEYIDDFLILSCNFIFELIACLSELSNVGLHFVFLLLRHECLSHSVGNGALVQGLVSLNSHLNFISYSDKKESSFGAIDGDLSDQLIEALGVEFFSDWADTSVSGLSALEFVI